MPDLATPLIGWFRDNARDLPWRRPGFGAWGTLVSEFMLQQTPVSRVVPHLEAWLARWPTPASLAADAPAEAVRQWANLGYPRRALWLHRAAVEIRDRGEGIEGMHLPRLTERFYRVDTHRSRAQGGTGLGLAIVKHIVNRHRGRLRIDSTRGQGSTFTVILPESASRG